MTGAELRLLLTLNGVKAYDISNVLGYSHTTMTRLCQPTRHIEDDTASKILDVIRQLKGKNDIITKVDISDVLALMPQSLD